MIQRKNAPPPNILWFNASILQWTSILQHIRRSKKLTACHQRVTVLLQFHVIYKSNKKPIQIATQKSQYKNALQIHYMHIYILICFLVWFISLNIFAFITCQSLLAKEGYRLTNAATSALPCTHTSQHKAHWLRVKNAFYYTYYNTETTNHRTAFRYPGYRYS